MLSTALRHRHPGPAPSREDGRGPTAVVATTPSDSHSWNLVFLQLLLEELGYTVHNLGPCLPTEDLVAGCREHRPDLLVLSSVNGHGLIEAPDAARAVRGAGLTDLHAVVGGKLTTDGTLDPGQYRALLAAGFDAVFTPERSALEFAEHLRSLQAPQDQRELAEGAVR
ncbi:cobalamin B12-binding domain-containing protein [Kitasatospora sp. NPDC051853]|uniref:cobalamin B12-binding domain-containing protein n=1 Tax=Kitasatospora sp. NPDC051853 TaxID=3364058 RepID=UPI0037ACCB48